MKYTIQEKEFTLAPVTPKRFAKFCEVIDVSDFKDIVSTEKFADLNVRLLNIGKDAAVVATILQTCLMEDTTTIDAGDVDLLIVDEVFNDFFSQRFGKSGLPPST
jgi:hypothetical protein